MSSSEPACRTSRVGRERDASEVEVRKRRAGGGGEGPQRLRPLGGCLCVRVPTNLAEEGMGEGQRKKKINKIKLQCFILFFSYLLGYCMIG